jgi:cytochrome c biogenesis protein CcdA
MLATVVETKDLLETVAASLVAGVGVTTAFAILIFGATRSADMVRDERPVLAAAAGGLAVIALLVVVAAIVVGIVVMTQK